MDAPGRRRDRGGARPRRERCGLRADPGHAGAESGRATGTGQRVHVLPERTARTRWRPRRPLRSSARRSPRCGAGLVESGLRNALARSERLRPSARLPPPQPRRRLDHPHQQPLGVQSLRLREQVQDRRALQGRAPRHREEPRPIRGRHPPRAFCKGEHGRRTRPPQLITKPGPGQIPLTDKQEELPRHPIGVQSLKPRPGRAVNRVRRRRSHRAISSSGPLAPPSQKRWVRGARRGGGAPVHDRVPATTRHERCQHHRAPLVLAPIVRTNRGTATARPAARSVRIPTRASSPPCEESSPSTGRRASLRGVEPGLRTIAASSAPDATLRKLRMVRTQGNARPRLRRSAVL